VRENAGLLDGVHLSSLHPGAVIDLETRSRRYRIEFLGGDKAWISGHPLLCPRPVMVQLQGSIGSSVESGFIGQGMHLVFQRLEDSSPVTTSEITGVTVLDRE
jgi:hypothetical protein